MAPNPPKSDQCPTIGLLTPFIVYQLGWSNKLGNAQNARCQNSANSSHPHIKSFTASVTAPLALDLHTPSYFCDEFWRRRRKYELTLCTYLDRPTLRSRLFTFLALGTISQHPTPWSAIREEARISGKAATPSRTLSVMMDRVDPSPEKGTGVSRWGTPTTTM